MPDISKRVDLLQLPPHILLGISLVTGVILYGPAWLIEPTGLVSLPSGWRVATGIIFLVTAVLFVVHWVAIGATSARERWQADGDLRGRRLHLHDLALDEKAALRRYIKEQSRTQDFSSSDGVPEALVAHDILIRPDTLPKVGLGAVRAYNIQPWAWTYLNRHPELVAEYSSAPRCSPTVVRKERAPHGIVQDARPGNAQASDLHPLVDTYS